MTTKVSYADFHHWKNAAGFACQPDNFEFQLFAMEKKILNVLQNPNITRRQVWVEPTVALQCVKEQNAEICLAAVKQDGWTLKFVNEQTEDVCLAAVKQNAGALQYVKDQTEDVCAAAVKQDVKVTTLRTETYDDCTDEFFTAAIVDDADDDIDNNKKTPTLMDKIRNLKNIDEYDDCDDNADDNDDDYHYDSDNDDADD